MISKKKTILVVVAYLLLLLFISERGALSSRDYLITKTKRNLTEENTKA